MEGQIYVAVEVSPGTRIETAAVKMVRLADRLGVPVTTQFNGVVVFARPGDTACRIVESYHQGQR